MATQQYYGYEIRDCKRDKVEGYLVSKKGMEVAWTEWAYQAQQLVRYWTGVDRIPPKVEWITAQLDTYRYL